MEQETKQSGGDKTNLLVAQDQTPAKAEAGVEVSVKREEAMIKGALILAKDYPRDEVGAYVKIVQACKRKVFAEDATYHYPRGGGTVEGPSIYLARELKRRWGNMISGFHIVAQDDDWVHLMGFAIDLETNARTVQEDKFKPVVQRRRRQSDGSEKTEWVTADERDLRELRNRRGAILERNCILSIIPSDVTDGALEECKRTMASEIKRDRSTILKDLLVAFDAMGVNKAMIEEYLEHGLDIATDEEVGKLRGIYTSIRDGQSKRGEVFRIPQETSGPKRKSEKKAEETKPETCAKCPHPAHEGQCPGWDTERNFACACGQKETVEK